MEDIQSKIDKWIEQGKAPVCSCCKKKPIFISDLTNGTGDKDLACIIGKCYQCSKQDYEKEKKDGDGQSFVDFIRKHLANFNGKRKVYLYLEDLSGIDLSNLNLSSALFLCCDLTLSNFNGANLSNSIFLGSKLDNSFLSNSTFEDSCLIGCSVKFALVESANLSGVVAGVSPETINGQQIEQAIKEHNDGKVENWFCEALSAWLKQPVEEQSFMAKETVLKASNLTNASFVKCDLTATALDYSRLQRADFSYSYLNDCSFSHVSLGDTFFSGAQLVRVDFSDSFTPDPSKVDDIDIATVNFDNAILTGTFLRNCYFLKASLWNVKAQRVDCRGVVFGPYSKVSGDFRNARFDYAQFLGVSLGSKESPIILKDCEFPHSFFCGVRIYTEDIDTANFTRTRFETLESFLSAEENDSNNDTEDARSKLIKKILENYKNERGKKYASRNSLVGIVDTGDNFISPAALNFDNATLGECEIKNIRFSTANFFNAYLLLTENSMCSFDACCLDNAYIGLFGDSLVSNAIKIPLFRACSFKNSFIACKEYNNINKIFYECAFNATAFSLIDDKGNFSKNLNAKYFKFVKCAFELTPLYNYFGKTLNKIVLSKCRFVDGQYMGLYSDNSSDRYKSENEVFKKIKEIINNTIGFEKSQEERSHQASPQQIENKKKRDKENRNKDFATRQYLWNMFASNFRRLAILGLESKCLCELRDLDLPPKQNNYTERSYGHGEFVSWLNAIKSCAPLFMAVLFGSAFILGFFNNFWPDYQYINIIIIILFLPFLFFLRRSFGSSEKQQMRKALWAKSIYYYGERAIYSLLSWLIVICIFGVLYTFTGLAAKYNLFYLCGQYDILDSHDISVFASSTNSIMDFIRSVYNCMYFSTVTFTTLGFGDFHPDKLTKLYAALEACIGAVMMALFVLSFARRTAAR